MGEVQAIHSSAIAGLRTGRVLAELDYFLRGERGAMRRLIAEIFDPATRY
jgi:hypothetical protein